VTTLAALELAMTEYDWRRVNNMALSLAALEQWRDKLAALTCAQREALPGMEEGRGDLVPCGVEILLSLSRTLGCDGLRVSDFGLLEGVLLSMVA